jgi:hypothetical protein
VSFHDHFALHISPTVELSQSLLVLCACAVDHANTLAPYVPLWSRRAGGSLRHWLRLENLALGKCWLGGGGPLRRILQQPEGDRGHPMGHLGTLFIEVLGTWQGRVIKSWCCGCESHWANAQCATKAHTDESGSPSQCSVVRFLSYHIRVSASPRPHQYG